MNIRESGLRKSLLMTNDEKEKHFLLQKMQHCRGWLSILRVAGRNRLFSEHQRELSEIDAAMRRWIGKGSGKRFASDIDIRDPCWSAENTDAVLGVIMRCLSELQSGRGLSPVSQKQLGALRQLAGLH